MIKFYKGDIPIPKTGEKISFYTEKFDFKLDHYDEVLNWLFPVEGIEEEDFNYKMRENYKKMVEKAIYFVKCYDGDNKAFELLIKINESVEKINPELVSTVHDLENIIGR